MCLFRLSKEVFDVMRQTPQHIYQVLTKRAENLESLARYLPWPENVWMGVSVENAEHVWRVDHLRRVSAAVRFLSLEPLLGPLDELNLDGIDWVIAGGESGPGARPMQVEWVRSIRDQCVREKIAFHFKQWVALTKNEPGDCLMAVYGMNGHLVGGFQFGRGAFPLSFWSSATHARTKRRIYSSNWLMKSDYES